MSLALQLPLRPRIRSNIRKRKRASVLWKRCFTLCTAIDATHDLHTALQTAVTGLCDVLDVSHSIAVLLDPDAPPLTVTAPPMLHECDPSFTPLISQVQQERQQCHAYTDELKIVQLVPLIRDNELLGALGVAGLSQIAARSTEVIEAVAAQLGRWLERHYLHSALQRRTRELAAICDTAIAISSQVDLPTTLHSIVEQAVHLVGAEGGLLFLCDDLHQQLEAVVSYQLGDDYCGQRLPFGQGLAGRAAVSHQIESINDYQAWAAQVQQPFSLPFRASLAVPLLQDDRLLGVLDVLHAAPEAHFSSDDIAIVQLFATQAVVAITNARLYDRANQHAARTGALARTAQLLDAHGDISASVQPLAEATLTVLGAQACLIMLSDAHSEMVSIGLTDEQIAVFSAFVNAQHEHNVCHSVQDTPEHQILLDPMTSLAAEYGFHSTIGLRLVRDKSTLGCMLYFYDQPRHWDANEVELAYIVANRMTALITNAQLYREVHFANELKAEFVSTVSHELRTPMGAIMGYTELLASGLYGPIPPTMREPLTRIKTNAEHLLAMINQMLDLTRIEARRLELQNDPFNPRDVLEAVVTAIEPLAVSKGLRFTTGADADVPMIVLGDINRIRQMLINLAGNSVKFTAQGQIDLYCALAYTDEGPMLKFTVHDTGVGISSEHLELIWEPFRQVDSSVTREYGGTGLGLAIVRKLAELMHGSATVESTVGAGSTFTITLPLRLP